MIKDESVLRLDLPESLGQTTQTLLEKTLLGSGVEVNCPHCTNDNCQTDDAAKKNIHETSDAFKTLPRILIVYQPRSQYKNELFFKNRVEIHSSVVINLKNHICSDVDKSKISTPRKSLLMAKDYNPKRSIDPMEEPAVIKKRHKSENVNSLHLCTYQR